MSEWRMANRAGLTFSIRYSLFAIRHIHPRLDPGLAGGRERPGEIDGAGGIFHDRDIEAELAGVHGREVDAVVGRKSRKHDFGEAPLPQIAAKPGWRLPVVLEERRIGIDMAAEALAQDEFGFPPVEFGMEVRSRRSLHTVVRPQGLRPVMHLDGFERLPAFVPARKRGMV